MGGGEIDGGELDGTNYIQVNGEKISGFTVEENDASGALVDAINAVSDKTGVVAKLDQDSELVLTAADGRNIDVVLAGDADDTTGLTAGVSRGTLTLQSDNQFDMQGDADDVISIGGS